MGGVRLSGLSPPLVTILRVLLREHLPLGRKSWGVRARRGLRSRLYLPATSIPRLPLSMRWTRASKLATVAARHRLGEKSSPPSLNLRHRCAKFGALACGASPRFRGAVDHRRGGVESLEDPEFLTGVESSTELAPYRGHHRPGVDLRYEASARLTLNFHTSSASQVLG
jgi:hypothetical protein